MENWSEPLRSLPGKGGHVVIAGAQTALLIDELPVLAAIAPFTAGGLEVRDAAELRVKESDRLSAVTRNLQAMGAQVEQTEDGWRIPGNQQLHGAEIESYPRSPHRHGVRDRGPARGRRDHDSQRRMRGDLVSGVLRRSGASVPNGELSARNRITRRCFCSRTAGLVDVRPIRL